MRIPIRPYLRLVSIPLAAIALVVAAGVTVGGGETTTIEAGTYFDYVAPDPVAPAAGSIRFGFDGSIEAIAADAELVPPADTNLSSLGNGAPTCLEVTRVADAIVRIAFVEQCTVTGTVELVPDIFGPGADAYVIGGRLAAPAELVDGDPAFGTLIGIPAQTGAILSVTFFVDITTGIPDGFFGETEAAGPVTMLPGGDVMVGAATIPAAVIDDASRASLQEAADLGVDATVAIAADGTIAQTGDPVLEVQLSVSFSVPTPVPTSAPTTAPTPAASLLPDTSVTDGDGGSLPGILAAAALATAMACAVAIRFTVRRMR